MPHISDSPLKFEQNGGGTANVTYRVDFPAPIGNSSTNKGIAKGDKEVGNEDAMANNQYKGLDESFLDDTATIVQKEMNLITRSVASSQVSQSLGLEAVVDEAYAIAPDGKPVGVSAFASGEQAMTNIVDEHGQPLNTITRQFDYSDPNIQKGLYDLEAVDYLTGQIDRHAGNIFINPDTGSVRGIDNDLCFGAKPLSEATKDTEIGAKAVGMPPLYYHEDTAAAIERLSPEEFRAMLENASDPVGGRRLTPQEIDNAVERLEIMKADIQVARAEGRVVAQFNKATYDASVAQHRKVAGERDSNGKHAACGNYVGRCSEDLAFAQQMSLQENSADIIKMPEMPRPPGAYEAGLADQKAKVKMARQTAVQKPQSPELIEAVAAHQQAGEKVEQLRGEIDAILNAKSAALNRNLELSSKALEKRRGVVPMLQDIYQRQPVLDEAQAKLLRVVSPELGNVQAGQKLTPRQEQFLNRAINRINNQNARQAEQIVRAQHVKAFVPAELLQAYKEANQNLAQAKANLDKAVDADPIVVEAVAAEKQYVEAGKLPLAQASLEQAVERVKVAEEDLAAARAADEAAWFNGQGSGTEAELENLSKNLAAAEAELKAAKEALQVAESALQEVQAQQPQIANNNHNGWQSRSPSNQEQQAKVQMSARNNASQPAPGLKTPPRPALGPRPSSPAPTPPDKVSVAQQLQNDRRKATIKAGAGTASLQNNNNNVIRATPQRPVLDRPQGPLPPLPDAQQAQHGWKKGSTGDILRKSGESSPRLQRQNSVGDDAKVSSQDHKPASPRPGGPSIGGRK